MTLMTEPLQKAKAGADLFDRLLGPSWLTRVDPETLEVSSCFRCPAAQATGREWNQALAVLGLTPEKAISYGLLPEHAHHCGNPMWCYAMMCELGQLTHAWRMLVIKRQEALEESLVLTA